ncbi:hypothetical protein K466DRAFT_514066 [Polyporus arcularius HHB13444]|uniref:Thioesterase/thiol ester dehydrase-isomerase n=1 Tax=Polyporus arcularius HHB13444 TaxID=1314778 RepID=A0A5C3PQP9_9APHY|nr:hypothetical protein K466DRAFT_514066 [Polyporus arcularius HHB13444]
MLPPPASLLSTAAVRAGLRRSLTTPVPSQRRRGVAQRIYSRRHYSSPPSPAPHLSAANVDALDRWINTEKQLAFSDTLRPEHLADLYVTLPTRDGSRHPYEYSPPREGEPLGYGHHLVFFHPRNAEKALRSDGTDADFCPPEPFTRRMWAGGRMVWKRPLCVGDRTAAVSTISAIDKKGFEPGTGMPMVFVKQKLEYRKLGGDEVCIEEERSHVYLATAGHRRGPKEVKGLPRPDFTFDYLPTPTTLFRFSALTFNGHYIHLDKEYAQKSEGYPERLVHGPLTALMLLDTTALHLPGSSFDNFEYRAINPIVVNRPVRICGAQEDKDTIRVWAEETESNVVGMTGIITLTHA